MKKYRFHLNLSILLIFKFILAIITLFIFDNYLISAFCMVDHFGKYITPINIEKFPKFLILCFTCTKTLLKIACSPTHHKNTIIYITLFYIAFINLC